MTSQRKPRLLAWLVAPVAGFASLAVLADNAPALVLVNESPSLPRGVYRRGLDQTPARGDVVAVDPPPDARRYLSDLGMPPDMPLLKRVAASGGEAVCATRGAVRAPARRVLVMTRDRRGVRLPVWRGCWILRSDELFVLGDTPGSFDSRYFGPVSRSEVRGVYREALTW